jgi:hypothetical protein
VICIIDSGGKVLGHCELAVSRESIEAFARKWLQAEDELVLEATTNTWTVVDLLRPFVARIAIANPLRVKAIAKARVKTDKIDAHILAQLLLNDFLPKMWYPIAKLAPYANVVLSGRPWPLIRRGLKIVCKACWLSG